MHHPVTGTVAVSSSAERSGVDGGSSGSAIGPVWNRNGDRHFSALDSPDSSLEIWVSEADLELGHAHLPSPPLIIFCNTRCANRRPVSLLRRPLQSSISKTSSEVAICFPNDYFGHEGTCVYADGLLVELRKFSGVLRAACGRRSSEIHRASPTVGLANCWALQFLIANSTRIKCFETFRRGRSLAGPRLAGRTNSPRSTCSTRGEAARSGIRRGLAWTCIFRKSTKLRIRSPSNRFGRNSACPGVIGRPL